MKLLKYSFGSAATLMFVFAILNPILVGSYRGFVSKEYVIIWLLVVIVTILLSQTEKKMQKTSCVCVDKQNNH